MIAKAGLGLIGLGALSVGGAAIAKPEWFGISSSMPKYTTLASKTSGLDGKWAKDYKIYFVDAESNDDWFEWAIKHRYNKKDKNNKTKFVGLTGGKGSGTDKPLAKACKEAYDAGSDNVKTTVGESDTSAFLEDNIWKYCSVGGKKPTFVKDGSDKGDYTSGLGNTHKDVLLSAEKDNDWAWHIKQKEFLNGTAPASGVFKKFHESNQTYKNEEKGTRLRDKCQKYYRKAESTDDPENDSTLKADALKKYCSLKVDGTSV